MNYILQHRQISTNYGDQSFYLNLSDKCKYKLDSYNGKTEAYHILFRNVKSDYITYTTLENKNRR